MEALRSAGQLCASAAFLAYASESDARRDRPDLPEVPHLPDGESTRAEVAEALRAQIVDSHCGMLPDSQVPAMLAVQQQRDRRMAARLLAAPKPTMLIAGGFHARRDLGAPLHLRDLGGSGNVQVLMLAEVGERVAAQQANFVWYTPAQPAKDYCEQMRKR